MTHVNIGVLLEQFEIASYDDFRKRSAQQKYSFLDRMRDTIEYKAQGELEQVLNAIEHEPGLKMCFRVSRDNFGVWNNIPNKTFARKLAFLTSRTIISFPFDEMLPHQESDYLALITLLCSTHPFLKENFITIVPTKTSNGMLESTINKLMPANFKLTMLEDQFEEKHYPTHLNNVYSPHLDKLSDHDVVQIRKEQKNLYERLELRLGHDLMVGPFEEQRLLDELVGINSYITKLEDMVHDVNDAIVKGSIHRLLFLAMSACAGLLLVPTQPGVVTALAALGSYQVKDIIKFILDKKEELKNPKNDDFYLTWKINHPGDLVSLRTLLEYILNELYS